MDLFLNAIKHESHYILLKASLEIRRDLDLEKRMNSGVSNVSKTTVIIVFLYVKTYLFDCVNVIRCNSYLCFVVFFSTLLTNVSC